ncbi:hypothetical protein [Mycoplasmopsis adleri]|uniref:hypothetical protein n=1 Tax=Mycoplasmopsis adleri TaxID=51362 RepID=UPI0038731D6E
MKTNKKDLIKVELPILKPLPLTLEFVKKIKGDNKLETNVIMLIAEDGDDLFFVNCLQKEDTEQTLINSLEIDVDQGILDDGSFKKIELCDTINLDVIYKMDRNELITKIDWLKDYSSDELPYLAIKDQLIIVDKISDLLADDNTKPKLVLIRKKTRLQSPTSSAEE